MSSSKNLKAVSVLQYAKHYIIISDNKFYDKVDCKLIVERATGKAYEVKDYAEIVGNQKMEKRYAFTLFLGVLTIYNQSFLFFVAECMHVCAIENAQVYSILQTSCLPFESESELGMHSKIDKIFQHLTEVKKLLSKYHFFSFGYNLSTSKNCLSRKLPTQEYKYAWNYFIFKSLIQQGVSKNWLIPLIQGFVGSFTVTIASNLFSYILISRRGFAQGGTRYYSRGLDDEGNVANWVESEQIINFGKYLFAHVMARGSSPLFFEQTGVTASINVTRNIPMSKPAFNKHISFLKENYTRTLFVNLMSKTKNNEQKLTDVYEELLRQGNHDFIFYEFIDFHECIGGDYSKLNPYMKKYAILNQSFKFYLFDKSQNKQLCSQTGMIRTNCLDCLDRTNAFQTKVAMAAVEHIINACSIDLSKIYGKSLVEMLDEKNDKITQFILLFKNIWADQGDAISYLYSGTGSLTSSVTRAGQKTIHSFFDHKFKSINRFFIGHLNIEDKKKQRAIDLLTGGTTENINIFEEILHQKLKNYMKEFTTSTDYKVYILSWNVHGSNTRLSQNANFFEEFNTHDMPDIIVVSLQEIINLSVGNIVLNTLTTTNEESIGYWKNIIFMQLLKYKEKAKYFLVECKALVGVFLMVLVQEKHKDKIGGVKFDTVKLGWKGTIPHKGAVIIKMNIEDTTICFTGAHLVSGQSKGDYITRFENLNTIHEKAFQVENQIGQKKQPKIEKYDYSIIIGDLNFRINLNETEAKSLIEKFGSGDSKSIESVLALNQLASADELLINKSNDYYMKNYEECSIIFLPTYKYQVNTNEYETKKGRTPSWTDRILFWSPSEYIIKVHYYNSKAGFICSDHKPICALLSLEIIKINQEKRDKIIKQYLDSEGIKESNFDEVEKEETPLDNNSFLEQ